MKNTKFLLGFLFILNYALLFSQGEFIVEIDRVTGHFTKPGPPIPACNWVYSNIATYDEAHSRYFFHGGSVVPDHLYALHALDGTVDYSAAFPGYDECQFDNQTGTFYELHALQAQVQYMLDTLDPSTGNETALSANILPISNICGGFSTFDEANHRFIVIGDHTVFSIDASSGAVVDSPSLGLLPGEVLCCAALSYDRSSSAIFSLLLDGQVNGNYYLVTINAHTGVITKIGSGNNLLGQNGSTAIDTFRHQMMYLYDSQLMGGFAVATFDMTTGNLLHNRLVEVFTGLDNFWGLEYDHALDKLYAMHWEITGFGMFASTTNTHCGICDGTAEAVPLHGTPPYTYMWSDGQTADNISGLCPGAYAVTVTDAYQQSASVATYVAQSPPMAVSLPIGQNNIICANDSLLLCPGQSYSNYLWNTGATTECIYVSDAGNYYLTATDNSGCSAESNHVAIGVYPQPSVSISVNGDTLTAYNALNYQWYLDGNKINGATSAFYVATTAGSYTVAIADTNGCVAVSNGILVSDVAELRNNWEPFIYPNPVTELLFIESNGLPLNEVAIYDETGRLVRTWMLPYAGDHFSVETLASGIYIAEIKVKGSTFRKRWIKTYSGK